MTYIHTEQLYAVALDERENLAKASLRPTIVLWNSVKCYLEYDSGLVRN
jgi:hypothetical protein